MVLEMMGTRIPLFHFINRVQNGQTEFAAVNTKTHHVSRLMWVGSRKIRYLGWFFSFFQVEYVVREICITVVAQYERN